MVDDAVAAVGGDDGLVEGRVVVGVVVGVGPAEVVAYVAGRLVGALIVGVLVGVHLREDVDAHVGIPDAHLLLGHLRVEVSLAALEGVDSLTACEGDGAVVGAAIGGGAVALVVVVDSGTLQLAADGDDGLTVLLLQGEGGQRSHSLQVDEHFGDGTHQVAFATGDGLHGALFREGEGFGVAWALVGGVAAVGGEENFGTGHAGGDADDGAHVLILQGDGGCGSLRDGSLRAAQQLGGVGEQLGCCGVGHDLL